MHLRRVCVLLLLDGMLCYVSVKSVWSQSPCKSNVSLLTFHLDDLPIEEPWGIKVPYCYSVAVYFSLWGLLKFTFYI